MRTMPKLFMYGMRLQKLEQMMFLQYIMDFFRIHQECFVSEM
jgi:hypothetical protein